MAFTKMLWVDGTPVISGSWNHWKSVSGNMIAFTRKNGGATSYVQKTNNKIAYYCVFQRATGSDTLYIPLTMSPDLDAIAMTSGTPSSSRYITDVNGIDWYWTASSLAADSSLYEVPDCLLSDTIYPSTLQGYEQAAQDLLDRIYAVPFHEDYQVGQTYTPNYCDKEKTLRKVAGVFLFRNVANYSTDVGYQGFSDNIDTIISTLMAYETPKQWNFVSINYGSYNIEFYSYSTSDVVSQIYIMSKGTNYGFSYCLYNHNSTTFTGQKAYVSRSTGVVGYGTGSRSGVISSSIGMKIDSQNTTLPTVGIDL